MAHDPAAVAALQLGRPLRIGTRGSALARWQADWVAEQLRQRGLEVELVYIATHGDQQQVGAIGEIGTQGVFTKELQRALLEGQIDLSVHSLKDLPTEPVKGLALTAVPERASPGDVLISRTGVTFHQLPAGAIIGTGSLRRQSQLLHARPDLVMRDIRGNVDTRLRKLEDGQYDALVLAEAGLTRLGLQDQATEVLPKEVVLPAVGQGALGLETRSHDPQVQQILAVLDHLPTHQAVLAERALLASLRGGCLAPIGAWARHEQGQLVLSAVVLSRDGKQKLAAEGSSPPTQAVALGNSVAGELIGSGAPALIQTSRAVP